ncbi:MAG: HAD-IA family hydrolase [Planctomycetes bacterium]|nr:HAD-IA family hydrolase [Planctomycetota bacterium]
MTAPRRAPLLFDLDGTLVDSLPDIATSANHVRVSFGLPPVDLATARGYVGEGVLRLLERALPGAEPTTLESALAIYRAHHVDQCTALVTVYPGVREALLAWRDAGHPMGVVTNKPEDLARRVLHHVELASLFGVVIGGDTTPFRKPDPAPVRVALRALGAGEPRRSWLIGDSIHDVRAGKAAGLGTVAVLHGYGDEAALHAAAADEVWRDPAAWPAPHGPGVRER